MGNKWSESLHPRKKGKFVEKAASVETGRGVGNEANLSLSTSTGTAQQKSDDSTSTVQNIDKMHGHLKKAVSVPKRSLPYRIRGAGRRAAVATATLAIAVGGLTACSTNDTVMDFEEAAVVNPDSVTLYNNIDGHPNLARICIDGIAFITTTRKGNASWDRFPEWDAACANGPTQPGPSPSAPPR